MKQRGYYTPCRKGGAPMVIFDEIWEILQGFRDCFSRKAPFKWFCIVVFAFLIRSDFAGVTSIVRTLNLESFYYTSILHFFHSQSYLISELMFCWASILRQRAPLYKINDHTIILGDTITIFKTGKCIPGVVELYNSSNQLNKPKYFWGHNFGFLAILTGNSKKLFATPIKGEFHQGVNNVIREEQGKEIHAKFDEKTGVTSIILMISMAIGFVKESKEKSVLVLDAFYFARSIFINAWECLDENSQCLLSVIVRGKKNAVAYLSKLDADLKTNKIYLQECFTSRLKDFKEVRLKMYGEMKTVKYLCLDLYWSDLQKKIRFVLVIDGQNTYILACSNLSFSPVDIIKTYSYRVKIETMFDKLKNLIGGFSCHFWSKHIDKLFKRGTKEQRKKMLEDRDAVLGDEHKRMVIASTVDAIESFINMAAIALGILQIISLKFYEIIWDIDPGYKRTKSSRVPSERDAQNIVKMLYYNMPTELGTSILFKIIKEKQKKDVFERIKKVFKIA